MKQRFLVQVVAAVVVIVFAIGIWASGDDLKLGWLRFFAAAVVAATAILWLWDRVLWKRSIIQRIRRVPRDVSGTWKGTLISQWINPDTGMPLEEKLAFLVIRQTASAVSTCLLTDESKSASSLAVVSAVDGRASLDYMYLNRPDSRVDHRSRMHHGSTSLDISGEPPSRMRGRYWTDRDTRGELDFRERRKKTVHEFDEAEALFQASGR